MNTQLEKKFEEYHTRESDRHDIRKIFALADEQRKIDIIEHIDMILKKFKKIHEETLKKQIEIIDAGVEDILSNLGAFTENKNVRDVLAELDSIPS